LKRPRLNILRTFEAAGRHLSFSLAAQDLNISQAAVSQQMRQLEAYLDTALFIRHNRRLSLTSTGQAYLDTVHEALDRLDTVTDQLFPGRHQQTVTLRCTSGVAALWLVPHLKSFQKLHRNIEIRIKTLEQMGSNYKIHAPDLEILIAGDVENDPDVIKLFTSIITPVCSPGLFAQRQRPTRTEDILEFELIHVLGYDDDWHRWFRSHVKKDVNVSHGLLVDGSLIAIEAAQRGDGIMLGRRPFIDHHLQSGELVEVFSNHYHLYADYYLRQPPKTMLRRECRIVANWLTGLALQQSSQ
jgi:LysR family glycine cleavage system transcriptional activator